MQMKDFDGVIASLKGLFWLAVIVGAIVIAGQAYDVADHDGWISHSGNASVMFPPHGWEQGQYVGCFAVISTAKTIVLDCSEATLATITTRDMDVTFWGKVTDQSTRYRCQRGQEAITCHLGDTQPESSSSK